MPPTSAELLNANFRSRPFRAVLFDFDGTLSLLREGWPEIMIGMMVERLTADGLVNESAIDICSIVEDFVMALNGQPTIVQMQRFAEEVQARGGAPSEPAVYGDEYARRLMVVVASRWQSLTTGVVSPSEWVVPHAHALLDALKRRGVALYLASGSELAHVRHEAELLGVAGYFERRLHAPADGDPSFSKRIVIEQLLADQRITGEELLGFGDGVIETQEVRRVGGVTVAVASRPRGENGVDQRKRDRLVAAGADLVIGDYHNYEPLLEFLFGEPSNRT